MRTRRSADGSIGLFFTVMNCCGSTKTFIPIPSKTTIITGTITIWYPYTWLFRYPDRYTIYDQRSFIRILKAVGAKEVPRTNDFPRFVKVMRTLHNLLVKDEEVVEANRSRLDESLHYQDESMLLTYDFYHAFAQ